MDWKLRAADQDFLRTRVEEVLHYLWDPIGVCEEPGAYGEYSSYVPGVMRLLEQGSSAEQIADWLVAREVEDITLGRGRDHALRVAATLVRWRDWLRRWREEAGASS